MLEQLELLTDSPAQWKSILNVTPEVQKKEIKPFVLLALKELEGSPDSRTSSLMNADKFAAVREVVRHVARLRSATKEPWGADNIKAFLESLRFNPECTAELTILLCAEQMYQSIPKHLRLKPGLVSLDWRIDLSLCQVQLAACQEPTLARQLVQTHSRVLVVLRLTDSSTIARRLTVQQFQDLRYTVASALKAVIVLERRKCMKD